MIAHLISTLFQQIFAAFLLLIAKTCIFLFFSVSASKFVSLLITTEALSTNRIQREFYSNNAIASQEFSPASKHPLKNDKPFQTEACCHFAPPRALLHSIAKRGDLLSLRAVKREGLGMGDAVTSRR
jgi:uncharacterized protein VirK/YbjX